VLSEFSSFLGSIFLLLTLIVSGADMTVFLRKFILLVVVLAAPSQVLAYSLTNTLKKGSIAFGSCLQQWQPQPVWQSVIALKPQAFVFLGDNVYSDVGPYLNGPLPDRINQAYKDLAKVEELRRFGIEKNIDVFATWDDHDYGLNDGGAEFTYQTESRAYFADFFGMELDGIGDLDQRGVYHSRYRDIGGLSVQFLMLDTRSYRSPLKKGDLESACSPTGIISNTDDGSTILGDEQWRWLAGQFKKPADLRIIASSIQVLPTEHCFEKWANFPNERQRLFDLIKSSAVSGVVIISGDRHLAEISKLEGALGYPLYEITASGLNSALGANSPAAKEPNALRTSAKNVLSDNFGSIQIERDGDDAVLQFQIHNVQGEVVEEVELLLSALKS
jgi:alkaline phosphatase D